MSVPRDKIGAVIPRTVARDAKAAAALEGITLQQFITEALLLRLEHRKPREVDAQAAE